MSSSIRVGFVLSALCLSLGACSRRSERTVQTDVTALLPPETANKALLTPLPHEVRITLRGSARALDALPPLRPIELDLRDAPSHVAIPTTGLGVPSGVTVDEVVPLSIALAWDDVGARELPVEVSVIGAAADGHHVDGKVDAVPERVSVRGPKSVIMVLKWAEAGPFEIDGLGPGTYSKQLPLRALPKGVETTTRHVQATLVVH